MQVQQSVKVNTQTTLYDDKLQEIVSFLLENYEIKISVHDTAKRYIVCKEANRKHIAPTPATVLNHLRSRSISISAALLRDILADPFYIPHVNPITEYFDAVRGKWTGESQIDLFCKHIMPRTFDDNTPEYYRQRTDKLIRKWMVACVACWLDKKHNDVALGFVSSTEGIGKTHLVEFLIPEALAEYYIKSSRDERKFDIEDVFTRYMLINFDECVGLEKKNFETFKTCLSADYIQHKTRHEEFSTKKPRLGCVVFTSNFNEERGGFIQEYWGDQNRRIGTIEITDIDREYSKVVDKDQMWSEALSLYENTQFDYKFDKPDYLGLSAYNARYMVQSDAMKIVQQYMAIPETKDEAEQLNATAILQRLAKYPKIKSDDLRKVTAQKIGAALTRLGYQEVSYRPAGFNNAHNGTPLKGYHVKFLE